MNRPMGSLSSFDLYTLDRLIETILIRAEEAKKAWHTRDDIVMHIQIDTIERSIRELKEIMFL